MSLTVLINNLGDLIIKVTWASRVIDIFDEAVQSPVGFSSHLIIKMVWASHLIDIFALMSITPMDQKKFRKSNI